MKITEKKKPVSTVPKGVWESSRPLQEKEEENRSPSVDMQENGYPVNKRNEPAVSHKSDRSLTK